ncbi:hypothetical protein HPULCUR_010229 [Helicostylum pulchrum]|uniref:Uncharacterized protein n=1 Tax=Helicostylum pulchrum TaxID=562976 RepID=A0ABP9YDL9_9FUNG
MSDPFQVKAESKSWAEMVEEEEEFERLQFEDESNHNSPSLQQPATDKSKELIKELPIELPITKEAPEIDQCTPPSELIKEELKKEELEELKRKFQLELDKLPENLEELEATEEKLEELEEPKLELEEPKQEPEVVKEELKEEPKEEPKVEETKEEKIEEEELKEEPKVEEPKVETPKVETPKVVKEEEPEQIKEEPKKEGIKLLSGSKASRWATAPSDPPKVSRWERPATSSYNEQTKLDDSVPVKLGSSASKWASAPTSKHSSNRSKYDTNDRYSSNYDSPRGGRLNRSTFEDSGRLNRSTFEDSGRLNRSTFEDSGRLNRSTFEDSGRLNRSTFESDSFVGSRNHYDRDFDREDRNGGFDNKNNFSRNRKVEPLSEQEAESIKQWNAYQPPADENDPVKPLPPAVVFEQKVSPVVVEQKVSPVVVEKKALPVVQQSPVKKEAVVQEKPSSPSILDFNPSFSWADDIDNSDDEYDMILEKKEGSDWSSFEEIREAEVSALLPEPGIVETEAKEEPTTVSHQGPENFADEPVADEPVADEPVTEIASEPTTTSQPEAVESVIQEEEKPIQPAFVWGSLEEEPKKVVVEEFKVVEEPKVVEETKVVEEPVVKVKETPTAAPTYTWGSLEEPTPQVEQRQAAQAPSRPISKEDEESALNCWNEFNKPEKPQEEAPAVKDVQTTDQVWEKYNPEEVAQSTTWNNNVSWNEEAAVVPQESTTPAWGAASNTPAPVEKSGIKDTWKAKLPVAVEDNASGWKSFAETVTAEPVIVEQKKKHIVEPVLNDWSTMQEPTKKEISMADEEHKKAQQNATHTISLVEPSAKAPKTISLSLADFVEPSNSTKKAPKTISLSLADFIEPSDKKAPKNITLNLQDFNEPKAPQNVSFSFSDLNDDNSVGRVAMKCGDLVEPAAKEPKEISLKWSDIDQSTKPREAPREVNLRWQDI